VQRVLALLGAVALIVGAIAIRQVIAGDDDGGGGGGGGNGGGGDDTVVLACVSELEEACRAMASDEEAVDVVVEDAGDTMDKLVAGDSGYDGWVTLAPWPEIVAFDRPQDALGSPSAPAASAELVLAVPDTATPCGDLPVTWRCLGDNAANVGLPPRTSATGLLLVGNAATGYFGRSDIATNDFEGDPAFDDWLDAITANDRSADPLSELLRAFPPTRTFDTVGTTIADYEREVPGSRADGRLPLVEPEPLATANVVVVPVVGSDGEDEVASLAASSAMAEALSDAGWLVGGDDATGLPPSGVLYDLLTR
jgi:hypothetical protein